MQNLGSGGVATARAEQNQHFVDPALIRNFRPAQLGKDRELPGGDATGPGHDDSGPHPGRQRNPDFPNGPPPAIDASPRREFADFRHNRLLNCTFDFACGNAPSKLEYKFFSANIKTFFYIPDLQKGFRSAIFAL